MVSSTVGGLTHHRAALFEILMRNKLFPEAMEHDSARPVGNVVDSSLEKVAVAAAYVGIIGRLYGTIHSSDRNPDELSLTELEFQEARRLGRPTLIFIMSASHPVTEGEVEVDPMKRAKLESFRDDVKRAADSSTLPRVYAVFDDLNEFKERAHQAVGELRRHLDRLPPPAPEQRRHEIIVQSPPVDIQGQQVDGAHDKEEPHARPRRRSHHLTTTATFFYEHLRTPAHLVGLATVLPLLVVHLVTGRPLFNLEFPIYQFVSYVVVAVATSIGLKLRSARRHHR